MFKSARVPRQNRVVLPSLSAQAMRFQGSIEHKVARLGTRDVQFVDQSKRDTKMQAYLHFLEMYEVSSRSRRDYKGILLVFGHPSAS